MNIINIAKMRLTVIEVVLTIIVVFILLAIAIPRFYNPLGEAKQKS